MPDGSPLDQAAIYRRKAMELRDRAAGSTDGAAPLLLKLAQEYDLMAAEAEAPVVVALRVEKRGWLTRLVGRLLGRLRARART
jgi:hypothetical protein